MKVAVIFLCENFADLVQNGKFLVQHRHLDVGFEDLIELARG